MLEKGNTIHVSRYSYELTRKEHAILFSRRNNTITKYGEWSIEEIIAHTIILINYNIKNEVTLRIIQLLQKQRNDIHYTFY